MLQDLPECADAPPNYSDTSADCPPSQSIPVLPTHDDDDHHHPPPIAPLPAPPFYINSHSLFLKTTDRILDDLRNDPYFLAAGKAGILNQKSIEYAERLASFIKSTTKYKLISIKSSLTYLNIDSTKDLGHDAKLHTFHGIIVPQQQSVQISNEPLYHFTIKIKQPAVLPDVSDSSPKHKFYAFDDTQLVAEDRKDLILDEDFIMDQVGHYSNTEEEYLGKVIIQSMPHLVDSTNLVSENTHTIVRIEVSNPILSYQELKAFEDEEIQVRLTSYLSQITNKYVVDNLRVKVPSTLECLNTLFRVLKGPFDNIDSVYRKTLKPDASPVLKLHLNLRILIDKFFFRETGNDAENLELEPPRFRDFGDLEHICCNYYVRALQEVLYVASIFAPDSKSFFKQTLEIDSHITSIFHAFGELDVSQHWDNWSAQQYNPGFTTLSVTTYYPDNLIIDLYNRMVALDSSCKPAYFDALTFCATSKGGQELQIYASTLKSQGMIGLDELKDGYNKLGFNPAVLKDLSALSDAELISSYKDHILISESKTEKHSYRKALERLGKFRDSASIRKTLDFEPMFDISDAYDTLETSPAVEDDVLITAYQLKAEDSSFYNPAYSRALSTIAQGRKSVLLMNYLDSTVPGYSIDDVNIEDAFNVIGADQYASDTSLIRIFQERVNNETKVNFPRMWKALKVIGDGRKSKLIEGFLSSGIVDSTLLSIDKTPAGLNNIGNTCYLNSLLQYYFVIKPLRELILNFDKALTPEVFESEPNYKIRRIGGRVVGYKETERSYQFMYQLKDLYYNMMHENSRCVTPTKELAYLSFSPIGDEVEFEHPGDFKKSTEREVSGGVISLDDVELADEPMDVVDRSLIDLGPDVEVDSDGDVDISDASTPDVSIGLMSTAGDPSLAVAKISHDQIENAFEIGRQQDVTECISNVLSQVESALDPGMLDKEHEQLDFVKKLFYGKTKQTLVPVDVHTKEERPVGEPRTKIERFLNLIVNIGDNPKDIYDALDTYFTEDLLELDNGEVKRSLTITELPEILQIQIQRVQFDRVRLIPVKSTQPLPFEEKLYMDRYMDTEDEEIIARRKEVFHWRRRIEELNEKKAKLTRKNSYGLTAKATLESTKQFLESETMNQIGILVDSNTIEVIDNQIKKIEKELNSIDFEVRNLEEKISQQFVGFSRIGYSIFAIFIHRGQASYGHYWIYIKDPKTGMFRKYNDEIVSEVGLEEVLNFNESNTATPYYMAFVKDDITDAIEPLKREIVENLVEEVD
ncbi:hypothetical protein FOA43_002587 [Brettanomyces nanus]|uniref:Ubiquitin carboxyl-terminal hydrolase 2 n=1 Tax=Eeniella nana TaxID=13502 RepID=A0A875RV46_EENNA|nr:uncharacterized protein FOA43_002587 [Brettanomyces nanus]QPG75237.1 hypothetical protein FOA43_002587 [Brettanomyces nanus]